MDEGRTRDEQRKFPKDRPDIQDVKKISTNHICWNYTIYQDWIEYSNTRILDTSKMEPTIHFYRFMQCLKS